MSMTGGEKPDRGKPSKAMGVEEFLDKGAGGAVLPRKRWGGVGNGGVLSWLLYC